MLRYAFAVSVAIVMGSDFSQVQPTASCDPTAALTEAQVARRRLTIVVARQINTAEAQSWAANKRFAPLSELTRVSVPEGFKAHVSTDGRSYTFSIKDLQDACNFALFSDQEGVIYTATPLR